MFVKKRRKRMKKTKIICSIGPASSNPKIMSEMVNNGMNVARINFSHAIDEERKTVVDSVKTVRKTTGKTNAILSDTKRPEFRNGMLKHNSINLIEGKTIRMVKEEVLGDDERFSVNHPSAIDSLEIGNIILLENGLMKIKVVSKEDDGVTCKIINGGVLGNKKRLSAPGVTLDIPFVSPEDREDIIYACTHEGDFIALSFVSTKEDVMEAKAIIDSTESDIKIISKIESTTGIENQKEIIKECRKQGKFVIVATEMMESMKHNARPTRAEVSDIANAVMNGTDAVMLSGETTQGQYPIETVGFMANICEQAESHIDYAINNKYVRKDIAGAIASSVVETSTLLDTKLIVAATISGLSARLISNLRPNAPILATCTEESIARSLALNWGVYPVITKVYKDTDEIVKDAKKKASDFTALDSGDLIVITGGFSNSKEYTPTNFMKIEKI